MTVRELLMRIDSRELSEWMAFYSIEPFGELRADMRAAMVAFHIAAGAGAKDIKIEDFLLKFDPPKQQSLEEIKAVLRGL